MSTLRAALLRKICATKVDTSETGMNFGLEISNTVSGEFFAKADPAYETEIKDFGFEYEIKIL